MLEAYKFICVRVFAAFRSGASARDKNDDGFCAGAWVSADSALKMKGSGTPKKHHRTSKSTERVCTFESKFARLHVRFHTRRDIHIPKKSMYIYIYLYMYINILYMSTIGSLFLRGS